MHTRVERKMPPSGQPARGAAARLASLEQDNFPVPARGKESING